MTPAPARVVSRRQETEDTWTLELDDPGRTFAPGQFNMLYAFGKGEVAISISGDPASDGPLVHTIRAVGLATQALCACQPGDVLGVRGPFGTTWPVGQAQGHDVLIMAGGVGLAPLRPAIYSVLNNRDRYQRVAILYGSRSPDLLLYDDELQEWAQRDDVHLGLIVDAAGQDWRGRVGVVTQLLDDFDLDPADTVAMVCGPELMMLYGVQALDDLGIPDSRIHLSMERNMQCGVGHCGHCQLGPTLVCRDGPVYSFEALRPWLTVREL